MHDAHVKYWVSLAPRLQTFVENQRDTAFDKGVLEALAFFSFVTEDFRAKATKNLNQIEQLATMIILTQDVLRGLLAGERESSPATLAALGRIALEVLVNLRFITKGPDPVKYADRYSRYGEIEKLLYQQGRDPAEPEIVSAAMEAEIRSKCPEWIRPNGQLKSFWTAEEGLRTLRQIAKAAGLEKDYRTIYAMTSKYVHGSPLLTNLYQGPRGIGAIGQPTHCKDIAFLSVNYCLKTLEDLCEFFGVEFDKIALGLCRQRLLAACQHAVVNP